VRRQKGIRIYQAFAPRTSRLSLDERLSKLIMVVATILSPITDKTLRDSLYRLRRQFGDTRTVIENLLRTGDLEQHTIDGQIYLSPAGEMPASGISSTVKFLSPFDPLVWDRKRFEHVWGWPYRFEAYTPKEKRIRGYYAMPLLWNTDIIGWANVKAEDKRLDVELGFIKNRPKSKRFANELEKEVFRLKSFLKFHSS
ncbi:MAG: winged helix DNA-binding domain-containing protein, partial [Candidatus Roizmanbacteria bacterium]|nr:winged helix DNA-binding domain-containing protein [Candidatus Roizmanbacteria bacterium]